MSVEEYEEENKEEKIGKNKEENEEKYKKNEETDEEKNEDKFTTTEGAPSISSKENEGPWGNQRFFSLIPSIEQLEKENYEEKIKNSQTLFLLIVTACDIITSPNSIFYYLLL